MLLASHHETVLMYAQADDADGVRVGLSMQADGSTVWQLLRVAVATRGRGWWRQRRLNRHHHRRRSRSVRHAAGGLRVRSKQVRRGRPCRTCARAGCGAGHGGRGVPCTEAQAGGGAGADCGRGCAPVRYRLRVSLLCVGVRVCGVSSATIRCRQGSDVPQTPTRSGTQWLPIQYRTLRSENKFRSDKDAAIL